MVDKLKEAALILKAKITKDEVEELLLEATSDENWQTPTTILHGLADAAYNYDQWQKISAFIWEKLKSKKWKKIIKTLNLIEFLLKNGPPSILSSFKYEVYQFKSFDGYNCYDDGVDRGEAIREKAKAIVELLTNEEFLQEERVKAKTIRERLAGTSSDAMYAGYGSKGQGSKYGNTSYKNEGGSKYAGQGSGSKNSTFTGYSTGSYDEGKSTLDKYKNYTGGSLYSKENLQKEKEKEKEKKEAKEDPKKEEEPVAPKAFQSQARTLRKPGEAPPVPPPPAAKAPTTNTTKTIPATTAQSNSGIDIFDFDGAPNPEPPKPTVAEQPKVIAPPPQPQMQQPIAQPPQTHPLANPMYSTTAQLAGLNLTGAPQPQPTPTNPSLFPAQPTQPTQPQQYPQYVNPMYPTTAPMAATSITPPQQPAYPAYVNPMYPTTAPIGFPQTAPQQQTHPLVNPMYSATSTMAATSLTTAKPTITMNTGVPKPPPTKDEDEFGGFESSNKDANKWMSKDESNLIDLYDLGKEMHEKKKDQSLKQQPQVKKKESNEGGLLATAEDFENFMSGPSPPAQSYNISMNINNVNFGVPSIQSRPVVDPLLHMGNVMGGMQYPNYGQFPQQQYPQMTPQQYQQYMQQQQQFGYRQ